MAFLEIRRVSVDYRMDKAKVHAVDNVSFSVEKGQSVGIVGESGSGKSTLGLAILQLLDKKTAEINGQCLLEGEDLLSMDDQRLHEIRWRKLAAVFQKSMNALSPVHKIGKQMTDVYRIHHPETSKTEAKERVLAVLRQVNLAERVYSSYPHELSGGMMQRVSIALSLLNNPDLIIFDEATTALDVVTQGQILKEVQQLEKELGLTRLMITHDISVVAASCSHVAVMYAGRLMEFGPTREVLSHPKHPYTQGLMHAYPSLQGEKTVLQGIPGALPDLKCDIPGWCSRRVAPAPGQPAADRSRRTGRLRRNGTSGAIWRKGGLPMAELIQAVNITRYYAQHTIKMNSTYPPVKAVDGVSFSLKAGQVLGVIGESGCGKSTLGRLLVQMESLTSGSLLIDGKDAAKSLKEDPLGFKRTAQIVFQNPFDAFNPRFTILKSMMRPLIVHGIGKNDAERKEICRQALVSAGLTPPDDFLRRFPHELSGGQLQRISILRSMLLEPKFMVADEPVSMLDVSIRADVMNLLLELTQKHRMAMVFISHDLATTRYIANDIAVMYLGKFVEFGPTEEVLLHPMHPYTKALLSSCGSVENESFAPIEISGEPPVPIGGGPGCAFAPRCYETCPACWECEQALREITPGHFVSCSNYQA